MKRHHTGIAAAVAAAGALGFAAAAPAAQEPQIPRCDQQIGALTVNEPSSRWWQEVGLESPEALIKVFVSESGCFTLVDRGKGLAAAQAERALASGGDLRVGSNVGKGQMRAADYILVPDIVNKNSRASGQNIGGLLGGVLGGTVGAMVGGVSLKSKTADVVLTLTDVRSTEQVSLRQGHARKTDLGLRGGGFGFFGAFAAAGASSYANTEIGQVVTMAYLDAFTRLVEDVRRIQPDPQADNVQQAVNVARAGQMFATPSNSGQVVQDLQVGTMLFPTGEKQGPFWRVQDELGNEGWVAMGLLQLAR